MTDVKLRYYDVDLRLDVDGLLDEDAAGTMNDYDELSYLTVFVLAENDVWAEEKAMEVVKKNRGPGWTVDNIRRNNEYEYILV